MTAVVHRPLAPPVVYVGVLNHEQRMLLRVLDGSLRDWMISLCEWMVSMCGWMDGSLRECMVPCVNAWSPRVNGWVLFSASCCR